jgi:hypothetical protein
MTDKKIDTLNQFVVAADTTGNHVRVLLPPVRAQPLTREQALNLAAYLVLCSMSDIEDFTEIYHAIANA